MSVRPLFFAALCSCTSAFGAVTLQNADSFWKFDGAASGVATNAQIIDSTGTHTAINAARLSWNTSVPAVSPGGGLPMDTLGRALNFGPTVSILNEGAAVADSVGAATFQVANGSVSGDFSVVTRAVWDGGVTGSDDTLGNQWLLNNGLSSNGIGFLFGVLGQTSGGNDSARLAYYTSAGGFLSDGTTPLTGTRTATTATNMAMAKGQWYDIGLVVSTGDGNAFTAADNSVTFYLYGPGGLQTQTFTGMYISDASTAAPGSNLTVGAESTGVGTGNQRKTYNGSLDYLAMFDVAMSQQEMLAIFAAPEPGRALLLLLGLAGLLGTRRRQWL